MKNIKDFMKTPSEIIDQLASKELSFGCLVTTKSQEKPFIFIRATRSRKSELDGKLKRDFHCYFDKTSPVIREEDAIILGHPVRLHDVLNKMQLEMESINHWNPRMTELCQLWSKLGLTKSLQEIEMESGYEEDECDDIYEYGEQSPCYGKHKRLKSPQARELENFIKQILNV